MRKRPLSEKIIRPFAEFARLEANSGLLLIACSLIALIWANSPWSESYFKVWEIHVGGTLGAFTLQKSLLHWINDGLMAIFFLLVGLEIKREALVGELSSTRQAALPILAALGGMVVPAMIYTLLNYGEKGQDGWGIPMATDIAFALGVLMLAGPRIPNSLKIFLTAIAIADDLGAVLVIAFFYSSSILGAYLIFAGLILGLLILLNRIGVRRLTPYSILGILLWFCMLKSGIHATVAGVLLAFTIPARLEPDSIATNEPLQRMERLLHPWVVYAIVPLFALANAGVQLQGSLLHLMQDHVSVGVLAGLFVGKPLGIVFFSWLAIRLRWAALPTGIRWRQVWGIGVLGGIGFTMSLFVTQLAFVDPALQNMAKIGILVSSILSGVIGWVLLRSKIDIRRKGADQTFS